MKFLLPDVLLVHASIKLPFTLSLVISQTKQNKTTISVHEFLSDSTLDYPIILLFDVRFSNNFIFLFYRYYFFNIYFFKCLCTYKPDVNIGLARETKDTKFFGRPVWLRWLASTWSWDAGNYNSVSLWGLNVS